MQNTPNEEVEQTGKAESTKSVNSDGDKITGGKKAKGSTMKRSVSFSMTRPWSSYAQNYSSYLSGLRRTAPAGRGHHFRQDSLPEMSHLLNSNTTSSDASPGLSKSLDTQQLRSLKEASEKPTTAPEPVKEPQQRPYKVSGLHARPFHQRRWSSPVAFSVTSLATPMTSKPSVASVGQHNDNGISNSLAQEPTDTTTAQTEQTDEIKSGVVNTEPRPGATSVASKLTENSSSTTAAADGEAKIAIKEQSDTSLDKSVSKSPTESGNEHEIQQEFTEHAVSEQTKLDISRNNKNSDSNKVNSEPSSSTTFSQPNNYIDSSTNVEEPKSPSSALDSMSDEKKNEHVYIKSNSKWSNSRGFRRRRHSIDSHQFLQHNLFTIAEQSSSSLADSNSPQQSGQEKCQRRKQLYTRKSKSLDDLTMLKAMSLTASKDCGASLNKNVSVQRLFSNPLSVTVKGGTSVAEPHNATVNNQQKSVNNESSGLKAPARGLHQVNVQTLNYSNSVAGNELRRRHVVVCKADTTAATRRKPEAIVNHQGVISKPQHVVFTQAKPKWASITISHV